MLILNEQGDIYYVSENIEYYLGFLQVCFQRFSHNIRFLVRHFAPANFWHDPFGRSGRHSCGHSTSSGFSSFTQQRNEGPNVGGRWDFRKDDDCSISLFVGQHLWIHCKFSRYNFKPFFRELRSVAVLQNCTQQLKQYINKFLNALVFLLCARK